MRVEHICEEVAIINHGRIVATGEVDSLRRASQRRRIELQLEESEYSSAARFSVPSGAAP